MPDDINMKVGLLYVTFAFKQVTVVTAVTMLLYESCPDSHPLPLHHGGENLAADEEEDQESSGWPACCGFLPPILQCGRRGRESAVVCFTCSSKQVRYFSSYECAIYLARHFWVSDK